MDDPQYLPTGVFTFSLDPRGETDCSEDLVLDTIIQDHFTLVDGLEVWLDIFLLTDERYHCISMEVSPPYEYPVPITGALIRDIPVQEWVAKFCRSPKVENAIEEHGRAAFEYQDFTREVLWTSVAYRYGYAVSEKPFQLGGALLGVSRGIFARRIIEARRMGYLGTQKGRP